MDIQELLSVAFRGWWRILAPPKPGSDADKEYAWRVSLVICIIGGRVVWLLIIVWALGFFAPLGFPGLAFARDVQADRTNISTLLADGLANRIDQTRIAQCLAATDPNGGKLWDDKRKQLFGGDGDQGLLVKYKQLTGQDYQLLTCDEVKIIAQQK